MARAIADQIVFLSCSNLIRTAAFYEDLLGFKLVVDQGDCRIVQVADGGGYLGYCQRAVERGAGAEVIVTLVVSTPGEVSDWYDFLKRREVEIPDSPRDNLTYGIIHFFFHDPDGYQLEIQAFLDPAWRNSHQNP